ncbi:rod shape-determining protein MreC [Actinomadura sp. HBU206391]|uniref:rod shape-determining protein MreC n=1 Tax=Actinomadura sp. HBU206391 TaxID=2731692 RepID=UPI00164FAFBE|nr:rod shape-determining protein MreC [Actinomadura sp. HBU206391]MBC6461566.1 rod shape-determining protein MreC [Actinomadura sp. HBU206391]
MNDTRHTRAVLGALLFVALALITVDYRGGDNSPLRGLRGFGAAIFGPIERVSASAVRPIGNTVDAITDAPRERRRADRLALENQRLREQLRASRQDQDRTGQLGRLLRSAGIGGYKIVSGQVISAGQGFEDTVTIDVGSRSGVQNDMTVMTGDGLVGRVTRVGPDTATVLLATDAASAIGSRVEDSKEIGIAQGIGRRGLGSGGANPIRLQLLDVNARLMPGQRIVTLGSQGERPYVPGVPIGTVEKVEQTQGSITRTAYIRPFVQFTSLDVVGVVVAPPKEDPRDAVLPPRPKGAPTPVPPTSPTPCPCPTGSATPGTPGVPPASPPVTPAGSPMVAPTIRSTDDPSSRPAPRPGSTVTNTPAGRAGRGG